MRLDARNGVRENAGVFIDEKIWKKYESRRTEFCIDWHYIRLDSKSFGAPNGVKQTPATLKQKILNLICKAEQQDREKKSKVNSTTNIVSDQIYLQK